MPRLWIIALLCLSASLFGLKTSAVSPILRVNETTTKVLLQKKQAKVLLALENSSTHSLTAQVSIELVDPQDCVEARVDQIETIKPGSVVIPALLSLNESDQILLYRLRYRISSESVNPSISEGIISLSEITPEAFEMQLAAPRYAQEGTRYRVQVCAKHPISSRLLKTVN